MINQCVSEFQKSYVDIDERMVTNQQLVECLIPKQYQKSLLFKLADLLISSNWQNNARVYYLDKVKQILFYIDMNIPSLKEKLKKSLEWPDSQTPIFVIINAEIVTLLNSDNEDKLETLLSWLAEFPYWSFEFNLVLIWINSYLDNHSE